MGGSSLVPRCSVIEEKSACYPLFVHARLPRFLWGTWKLLLYYSVLHDRETWESFTSTRHSSVQPSRVVRPM